MKISEIKSYIEKFNNLAIEIAGPTLHGYDFMKKNGIAMPPNLIVTNVSKEIEVWDRVKDKMVLKTADELADITNLPYEDNSVSLIFVSNLLLTAESGVEAVNIAKREYNNPLQPITNLHLYLYKEASRVLVKDGLIIQVSAFKEDLSAFPAYSLTKEYQSMAGEGTLVLRKSSKHNSSY